MTLINMTELPVIKQVVSGQTVANSGLTHSLLPRIPHQGLPGLVKKMTLGLCFVVDI